MDKLVRDLTNSNVYAIFKQYPIPISDLFIYLKEELKNK